MHPSALSSAIVELIGDSGALLYLPLTFSGKTELCRAARPEVSSPLSQQSLAPLPSGPLPPVGTDEGSEPAPLQGRVIQTCDPEVLWAHGGVSDGLVTHTYHRHLRAIGEVSES